MQILKDKPEFYRSWLDLRKSYCSPKKAHVSWVSSIQGSKVVPILLPEGNFQASGRYAWASLIRAMMLLNREHLIMEANWCVILFLSKGLRIKRKISGHKLKMLRFQLANSGEETPLRIVFCCLSLNPMMASLAAENTARTWTIQLRARIFNRDWTFQVRIVFKTKNPTKPSENDESSLRWVNSSSVRARMILVEEWGALSALSIDQPTTS